ncbi:MAG TPA: SDR family NAD(P)-dependent oxidoreductase [Candidatus Angelobacter sp.]|nr:SDR family NAD(P)-dependent oxidoreductase [Candidatus Angelobacter sp.]
MSAIAIVGMACRYPDARSPRELWENVLAQRRSFRRIPAVRLRTEDYSTEGTEDGIYLRTAAVLEGYKFDRVRFQVSKETFESTDLVHWLALDVAAQALEDAKLLQPSESERERTGVFVGNSLTGEFSRANLLRLRWPYVRRVLAAVLQEHAPNLNGDLHKLLDEIEDLYKSPFPATTEESLAGGLSNTIAGRICNYFDFKGGGYTVDGACASSLLAVANACSALQAGDVDVAIAGGVDLSLDPFELAGFSKLGALARGKMRVFDEHSSGFVPGEGCGMVVLMRDDHAAAQQLSPYALIRGWGISSDGSGGITRPEASGQLLALRRAYHRACYGIDSVFYLEGHGTGTTVGDATELQALSLARHEAHAGAPPAALGSIKANIGHTKAAAGVAGLMKAAMAVRARVVPPTTGCDTPHPQLRSEKPALRIVREGELWPEAGPVRAGVSAMGFGGINTHVTIEAADTLRRRSFTGFEQQQLASAQDFELFLFQASDGNELMAQLRQVLEHAGELSYAELGDLAAWLAQQMKNQAGDVRAACVAATPEELETGVKKLLEWCAEGAAERIDVTQGLFLGANTRHPRIGFVFPGQGSPVYVNGGMWSRRFPAIQELYQRANLPAVGSVATEVAQPCVVTASLAGLHALELCGIEACIALGHSLGEITALCWAGACGEDDLLRLVKQRGRIMAEMAAPHGSMASVRAGHKQVKDKLNGDPLAIAAYNSPRQTVVSGKADAVREFTARLHSAGIAATVLPVSHAFHSPLVGDVATAFAEVLAKENFAGLSGRVASTVTGAVLEPDTNLRELLKDQITMPVQFSRALEIAAAECDLLIEVGPGAVLSGIGAECTAKPIISVNAGAESLRGLLLAAGAAFALGSSVRPSALFDNRFARPFNPNRKRSFLKNPCETILQTVPARPARPVSPVSNGKQPVSIADGQSAIEVLRTLVAQRTELPLANIKAENRFLDDLHLNSITVSQIILQAAAQLGLAAPAVPSEYANVSIHQTAATLEGMRQQSPKHSIKKSPQGVDSWLRVLGVEWMEQPLRPASSAPPGKWQIHAGPDFPLRAALEDKFRAVAGSGIVCCVPARLDSSNAAFLLECVQKALLDRKQQIVFVQDGSGASALARTLYLEHPSLKVSVVNVPLDHAKTAYWVAQEAASASGFIEAQYDRNGTRREPRLKLLWPSEESAASSLTAEDVLLVTGGGKGIAAECALELARQSKCHLALLGRSDPASDQELAKNLARLAHAGISFRYFVANVSDKESLSQAIGRIYAELGWVTAVLHGAGTNLPKRVEEISAADLHATIAPKVIGLQNLLESLDAARLRLLVTFGSIIGRTGLHGEAHYGLANEWLTTIIKHWQADHPSCRCVNLEWSVWAGAGMGQRLGVLESLVRQGITPLPLDDAISALKKMIGWQQAPVSSIITGRFGNLPTLQFPDSELPLRRFLEHIQVHYPGIELIADAELNAATDPYVTEHVFQGEQLLPAVSGIEAMAQAAMALEATDQLPEFRQLRFEHPIIIPADKPVTIRIAALRRNPGHVSLSIRCSNSSFQVNHFTGECIFAATPIENAAGLAISSKALPLDPARDLYGGILFHQGRFRRVDKYHLLEAGKSVAELKAPATSSWYARHLPADLAAGDPASRDAALHSIQACIPHKTILPVGIDRVISSADWTRGRSAVHATERLRDGNDFIYDVTIADEQGQVCECWQGLHLHAVGQSRIAKPLALPLLGPYLERILGELIPSAQLHVMLAPDDDLDDAIRGMFGPNARLVHRADGKPEIFGVADPSHISISHSAGLTLIISGKQRTGCDLEKVKNRESNQWNQLLGENFPLAPLIAEKTNTSLDAAATQVWSLNESLRKAGASFDHPLRLQKVSSEHWVVLNSGAITAAAFQTRLSEADSELAFAFVINNGISPLQAGTSPELSLTRQTNTEAGMQ